MSPHVVLTYPHALAVAGGGTVHCVRLAHALREAGADVTLLPIQSRSESLFPRPAPPHDSEARKVVDGLTAAGVDIQPLPQHPLAWWFDGVAVRRRLRALLDERPVEAVLGWWCELAYSIGLLSSRNVFCGLLAAAPYSLWWSRPSRPHWLHREMDERIVAGTARRVSRVFANSSHTASEVVDLLGVDPGRVEVIHPPLSGMFSRPRRLLSGKIERLIFFGRLRAEKGILDLIEALGQLESEQWQLRVAGAGDADAVARAASRQGIMDRVTLLGQLEPAQLAGELDRAQLAVLPSHTESFGFSVVEAQLAGLPVIACDAGAVGDICRDGDTGWLVPKGRVDRLAEAIRQALSDGEETIRRGERARDSAHRLLLESPAERILQSIDAWRSSRVSASGGIVS